MNFSDELELTRSLLAIDTVNPPGNEAVCARRIGHHLQALGFAVRYQEFASGRANLVASIGGAGEATDSRVGEPRDDPQEDSRDDPRDNPRDAPIVFTGHLDTVPLGAAQWRRDPFAGEVDGDRLYGRGSSDMKGGIAAMLVAAQRLAPRLRSSARGLVFVLTAAEEGGCVGSRHLVASGELPRRVGAVVVGEPTSNYPHVGHKGTIKFHARFDGVAAHGSMPHLGENAIYKAACAACRLQAFRFGSAAGSNNGAGSAQDIDHPVMGRPTLNVGTLHAGDTINSVPDRAVMGVDIRTVAGMDHAQVLGQVRDAMGPQAQLDVFQDSPPVWTAPVDDWVRGVFDLCGRVLREPIEPRTTTYNTDAGNLRRAWPQAPVLVLGPGDAPMAHQTDESCSVMRLREAVALYETLMADWCSL